MTANEVTKFENNLKAGDKVRANWTNCGQTFTAIVIIVKINAKSYRVALEEATKSVDGIYPKGYQLVIPTQNSEFWSRANRLEAI